MQCDKPFTTVSCSIVSCNILNLFLIKNKMNDSNVCVINIKHSVIVSSWPRIVHRGTCSYQERLRSQFVLLLLISSIKRPQCNAATRNKHFNGCSLTFDVTFVLLTYLVLFLFLCQMPQQGMVFSLKPQSLSMPLECWHVITR